MIHVFIGTKAQFIKMVPIMKELQRREIPFNYVDSGQHAELTTGLRRVFNISAPDYSLTSSDRDITKIKNAIAWFAKNIFRSLLDKKWLTKSVFPKKGICLIHGDTLSTLLGAFMALMADVKVCHVEAGLRSYNWIDPFPEEIIRMICMRCSKVLFAPSKDAFENLNRLKVKGAKYMVRGNTVIDAIRYIEKQYEPTTKIDANYAMATCHRFETLSDRTRLSQVVDLLNHIAIQMPVVFVIHKPTKKYLEKFELLGRLSKNILLKEMMPYPKFLTLMTLSEMVLTDGGSIQEECAFLNKKCLIIRNKTERTDGIGINAMLWEFNDQKTKQFAKWTINKKEKGNETHSPAQEIVDCLVSRYHK